MPYVKVPSIYSEDDADAASEQLDIFYRTYGTGETKIVFIMGTSITCNLTMNHRDI